MNDYQRSLCDELSGLLHNYKQLYETKYGVVERCEICGDTQFFSHNVPNEYYLQFHIRSALQLDSPLFHINYPNFNL